MNDEETFLYFGYGSNLDKEAMNLRCPSNKEVASVVLEDYRMIYNNYATIEKSTGDKVLGAVYEIAKKDLSNLDYYEGYPRLYNRKTYTVKDLGTGEKIEAMGYFMENPEFRLPSDVYFLTLVQGYRDWNLPLDHLYQNYAKNQELAQDRKVDVAELRRFYSEGV